jgi:imidazolonepropionase
MIRAELIVEGIGELATLAGRPAPRIGAALGDLGIVRDAALGVDRGKFVFAGPAREARRELRLRAGGARWDCDGAVVVPGFVDPHTHALFAGSRHGEVESKVQGASYGEIARKGGGLFSTVRATRRASDEELIQSTSGRLDRMALGGTTTVEVKSGYALTRAGELRLLRLIPPLARSTGLRLVPTYLGAHAVPTEFTDRPDDYIDGLISDSLPAVAREQLAGACDVFCEPGFFSPSQAERLLRAAAALGLRTRIHADEFVRTGGARLAARLGASTADHLLATTTADRRALARAGVASVLLPVTPFACLAGSRPPGRELVDAGAVVALGSDLSPNSWVESMTTVLSHAVYGARLTPSEAIAAATVNSAYALGISDVAGSIEVGRDADFSTFRLSSSDEIPYRMGVVPERVYRQGIRRFSREVGP